MPGRKPATFKPSSPAMAAVVGALRIHASISTLMEIPSEGGFVFAGFLQRLLPRLDGSGAHHGNGRTVSSRGHRHLGGLDAHGTDELSGAEPRLRYRRPRTVRHSVQEGAPWQATRLTPPSQRPGRCAPTAQHDIFGMTAPDEALAAHPTTSAPRASQLAANAFLTVEKTFGDQ